MSLTLHLQQTFPTAVTPTEHVMQVAAMFGLGVDQQRHMEILPPITLEMKPHQLIFITGPSGSGKSTILRLIRQQLARRTDACAIDFDAIRSARNQPVVDCFAPRSLQQTLRLLSLAGLNDAFVMLCKPRQLSDGQRYRLRLALAMSMIEPDPRRRQADEPLPVILADEFGATLDRLTAANIARNLRRWINQTPVCFVAATTHDDLLEPLQPDVLIDKQPGRVAVMNAE